MNIKIYNSINNEIVPLTKRGESHHLFGGKLSEKTKAKMSLAKSGKNHPLFGKKLSEKTKAKISKANLGKSNSEDAKAKMSLSKLGKKCSEETKAKMYLSRRRKTISDENYELLLKDFSKIDKVTRGVTYRKLCIKYNLSYQSVYERYKEYKTINFKKQ